MSDPAVIYTKRTENQPPYPTAAEQIAGNAEILLANELIPYFASNTAQSAPPPLTATVLNTALTKSQTQIQNGGLNTSLGNNAANKTMQLLTQILGIIAIAINITRSLWLPKTVLNQASVNRSLQAFSQSIGMLKQMQAQTSGAFRPRGFGVPGLSAFSAFANVSKATSSLQKINLSINAATTTVNLLKKLGVF